MTRSLAVSLSDQGLDTPAQILANLGAAELVEHAVTRGEGRLAKHGPLVVETGKHEELMGKGGTYAKLVARQAALEPERVAS